MKIRHVLAIVSMLFTLEWFQNCSPVNFEPSPQMAQSLAIARGCNFNGQNIADGQSITTYASPSVTYGNSCLSETRVCKNGVLSGSFTNTTCVVGPPADCSLNGQLIANGSSVFVYQSDSVPYGSACNGEYRLCTNGVLSGSFTQSSCTVQPPLQNPPLPPAGINVHIQCYVNAGWYQTLRVTTADGVAHDYGMGAGEGLVCTPLDVVFSSPPVSFQAFHGGVENAYRWPSPYTGITSNSVGFETEDGFDYDYNDLDCYFSW